MSNKVSRFDAITAIVAERNYQDSKWVEEKPHSPTEWLVFIEDYVREAKVIATRQPTPEADRKVLCAMRKIAAMGMACMEQNGVVTRAEEGKRPIGFTEA